MRTFLTIIALLALTTPSFGYVLMCYYTDWSAYRPDIGAFTPEDVDPTLCTHLMYSFVGMDGEGNVTVLDPWMDLPDDGGSDGFGKIVALKKVNPALKVMASVGGWSAASTNFTIIVNSAELRSTFTSNVVAFLEEYCFDGFDLDWEYPAQRGGESTDVEGFVLLLKEMREAFDKGGYLLTAAVGAAEATAELSYDIPKLSQYLDYIGLMTYDLHGPSDSTLGINSPLYSASYEAGNATELQKNVNACVNYWIDAGADPSKLILGIPAYAKTFTLLNLDENTPGSRFNGSGLAGNYTQEAGTLAYYELCSDQLSGNWTTVWSEEQQVPYSYSGDQWAGYDDVRSVGIKTQYAINRGLAGVMFWAIDLDDFQPICSDVKFPLITTARNILFPSNNSSSISSNCELE